MPEAAAVHATIRAYVERFSAGDREGWLDLWADGATMEDPVGSPVRRGRDEIGALWDQGHGSADSIEMRLDGDPIVLGAEAAFRFEVRPVLGGTTMTLTVIDVMTFDEEARILSQRAFVDFARLAPAQD
jgi:steroid delta-isomerase